MLSANYSSLQRHLTIKILSCEGFHPAAEHRIEKAFQLKFAGKPYCFIIVCYLLEVSLKLDTSLQTLKFLLLCLDNRIRHPTKVLEVLESYLKEIIFLRRYLYMSE